MAACNDGADKDEENNSGTTSDLPAYLVNYSLEIVNNTDSKVIFYEKQSFYKNLKTGYISSPCIPYEIISRIDEKSKKNSVFAWSPKHSLDATSLPYMSSFLLRLNIGGSDYYLAGWPAELNRSITEPPAAKIVQNGIGWAENRDARINDGATYIPFTVHYGNQYKDFDEARQVYAKATLTINANSKDGISFVTTSLQITEPE
jgi:hypothetical protein